MEKVFSKKELGELNLIKCPSCEGVHFRHAGDIMVARPYKRHDGKEAPNEDVLECRVRVCVGCGKPYAVVYDTIFDASEYVNVEKWDKVNKFIEGLTGTDAHCQT